MQDYFLFYNVIMEKKKEFLINIAYIVVICAIVYFSVNYVFGLFFPFIMGFIFAYFAIKFSRKFLNSENKLNRCIALTLIYFFIVAVIGLLVSLGINKLGEFFKTLPTFYKNVLEPYIFDLENSLLSIGDNLPENVAEYLSSLTDDLFDALRSLLSASVGALGRLTTSIISNVPNFFVSLLLMIISSYYMTLSYFEIAKWVAETVSQKTLSILYEIKDFFENTIFKIIGAYAAIMFITFIELSIGLSILKVPNSIIWSVFIAFLDILPVLGTGTVLIPWGISAIITGSFGFGIGILILYIIISIIRHIIEPNLVGANLGLHPLVTLISMIVGLRLFGAIGMFGLPLALSFFHNRSKISQQE